MTEVAVNEELLLNCSCGFLHTHRFICHDARSCTLAGVTLFWCAKHPEKQRQMFLPLRHNLIAVLLYLCPFSRIDDAVCCRSTDVMRVLADPLNGFH